MGFRIEPTQYKLRFEDPRLNGLTVVANSVSIAKFMEITGMPSRSAIAGVTLKATAVVQDPMLRDFSETLVSWDLEGSDGKEVPADYDGLASQEPWVVKALVKAWMEAVSDVTPPLSNGSGLPGGLPELSLPMDLLSDDPPS